jgi:molecular chaperone GrpE (heat shock protein)
MSSSTVGPRLIKWPFFLGDALLAGLAAVTVYRGSVPLNPWETGLCLLATIAGAWFCALPFLREYQGALKLSEAAALATTVAQIQNLEQIKTGIVNASNQWQAVREHSTETVSAVKEIADRMKTELSEFCAFLQKANDTEKSHLRLEVEKLRRAEREWLQASVHVLDHVFALHTAAARSGQPALMTQLNQFQLACRDQVRRLGLVGFAPAAGDPFDPQVHQLPDGQADGADGLRVKEILAPGYTFQGELVRRALVRCAEAEAAL